jgi:hypothetical protein
VGHFPAQKVGQNPINVNTPKGLPGNTPQDTPQNLGGNAPQKNVGQIPKYPTNLGGNAPQKPGEQTEWFRYEIECRDRAKGGYFVIIRKRLKWSKQRYAQTIVNRPCPNMTSRQAKSINLGKITDAVISALRDGGVSHAITEKLVQRAGRGTGKRASELKPNERFVLSRIESSLAARNGNRGNLPRSTGGQVGISNPDVPEASNGGFTDVPNVH